MVKMDLTSNETTESKLLFHNDLSFKSFTSCFCQTIFCCSSKNFSFSLLVLLLEWDLDFFSKTESSSISLYRVAEIVTYRSIFLCLASISFGFEITHPCGSWPESENSRRIRSNERRFPSSQRQLILATASARRLRLCVNSAQARLRRNNHNKESRSAFWPSTDSGSIRRIQGFLNPVLIR